MSESLNDVIHECQSGAGLLQEANGIKWNLADDTSVLLIKYYCKSRVFTCIEVFLHFNWRIWVLLKTFSWTWALKPHKDRPPLKEDGHCWVLPCSIERGRIGIGPIRSCEWGSAHICVRLRLIWCLFGVGRTSLLSTFLFLFFWFPLLWALRAASPKTWEGLVLLCRKKDKEVVSWREDGAQGCSGGSCLHTTLVTSHNINSQSAHCYRPYIGVRGRRGALTTGTFFILPHSSLHPLFGFSGPALLRRLISVCVPNDTEQS